MKQVQKKVTDETKFVPNMARHNFSLSPTHFEHMEAADMCQSLMPQEVAKARASSVLPVPGGPNSKIPFGGEQRPLAPIESNDKKKAWKIKSNETIIKTNETGSCQERE